MIGDMQKWTPNVAGIIEHAREIHPKTEIISRLVSGEIHRSNYEKVCTGTTGHAEVVKVIYDEKKINLNELLKIFWESHNPTQLNRQGNDIGTQYRSIILTDQKNLINELEKSKEKFQQLLEVESLGKIQTEIKILKNFYVAEDYHQKYLYKNPNGYCGLKGLQVNYT